MTRDDVGYPDMIRDGPARSARDGGGADAPAQCPALGDCDALLALLQLADGLFPAGGFAHSLGLETYVHDGLVKDRAGLEAVVIAHLEGAAGPGDAVAAAVASRLAAAGDLAGCLALDRHLEAMKPVPELRAASRQMGRQTLRVAAALRDDAFLASVQRALTEGLACGHHAVVFGAVLGREAVAPENIAVAYLYSTAALLVGAGVRLLALGQTDGQRVLAAVRPCIARLAADAAESGIDDMWTFTPGLDVAGIRHAALDARLFRS